MTLTNKREMESGVGSAPTDLGALRIGRLLRMYAVPGIIAQTAASLYNMVDSIFIGHIRDVGAMAISGLAVTFPLMNLSAALGTLVGVGGMMTISVMLGRKDYDSANKVLGNVFVLNILVGLVFTLFSLLFLDPVLRFFGASDNTLPYAHDYMVIILAGNVISHLYYGLNGVIRASGHPKTAMGLTVFTVLSNAVLDPIFIFGLDMGIRGAAVATVICQVLALIYAIWFFTDKSRVPHFSSRIFSVDWKLAGTSLSVGVSPFLMNAAACMVAVFTNQQLVRYGGDMAIGAFGICHRITFMFAMIVMGLNQGMQPIAGYNYGARLYTRVRRVFIITSAWAVAATTACFLVSVLMPRTAVSLFTNDPGLIDLASRALVLMNMAMPLVGLSMVTSNFFQCLGMVWKSIFLSLSRQLLFLLPLLYILPLSLSEKGVWLSLPVSDALAVVCSIVFIWNLFRKFSRLKDGESSVSLGGQL